MRMPGTSYQLPLPPLSAEERDLHDRLRAHVVKLAGEIGERNMFHYSHLQHAAGYIATELRNWVPVVREEPYRVQQKRVANIVAEVRGSLHPEEIVVIGAHYDSVAGSPGANDNASGVAALLELARLLGETTPQRTLRLVAFVNEEPPWFQTEEMGSLVYARQARERGEKIVAMVSIETIGSYSDRPGSQQYPAPLGSFYPDTGNFIGFVGNTGSRELLHRAIATFRRTTRFPSEGVAAPQWLTGIGWSDHWSFWQAGYPAIMVTDTAPFRYEHYHGTGDTPERLDYARMARVCAGLARVTKELVHR